MTHLDLQAALDPQYAFKGGRTNATRLYNKADPEADESIRYYDYTSLYLWVNKQCQYPVGHPQILYDPPSTYLSHYFGLAKVTILCPCHLFHPVLPFT